MLRGLLTVAGLYLGARLLGASRPTGRVLIPRGLVESGFARALPANWWGVWLHGHTPLASAAALRADLNLPWTWRPYGLERERFYARSLREGDQYPMVETSIGVFLAPDAYQLPANAPSWPGATVRQLDLSAARAAGVEGVARLAGSAALNPAALSALHANAPQVAGVLVGPRPQQASPSSPATSAPIAGVVTTTNTERDWLGRGGGLPSVWSGQLGLSCWPREAWRSPSEQEAWTHAAHLWQLEMRSSRAIAYGRLAFMHRIGLKAPRSSESVRLTNRYVLHEDSLMAPSEATTRWLYLLACLQCVAWGMMDGPEGIKSLMHGNGRKASGGLFAGIERFAAPAGLGALTGIVKGSRSGAVGAGVLAGAAAVGVTADLLGGSRGVPELAALWHPNFDPVAVEADSLGSDGTCPTPDSATTWEGYLSNVKAWTEGRRPTAEQPLPYRWPPVPDGTPYQVRPIPAGDDVMAAMEQRFLRYHREPGFRRGQYGPLGTRAFDAVRAGVLSIAELANGSVPAWTVAERMAH